MKMYQHFCFVHSYDNDSFVKYYLEKKYIHGVKKDEYSTVQKVTGQTHDDNQMKHWHGAN